MTQTSRYNLVAAIHLNSRGFGFVLFEGPLAPLDWGIAEARGKEKRDTLLARVEALFARYEPNVIILQDMSERGTHRPHRIRHLNDAIVEIAERYGFPVLFFSRAEVRQSFAYIGAVTKDTIAAAIAKHIPAFERFLPPPRKLWNSEDARMGIFDAAALALTFYSAGDLRGESRKPTA